MADLRHLHLHSMTDMIHGTPAIASNNIILTVSTAVEVALHALKLVMEPPLAPILGLRNLLRSVSKLSRQVRSSSEATALSPERGAMVIQMPMTTHYASTMTTPNGSDARKSMPHTGKTPQASYMTELCSNCIWLTFGSRR